MQVNARSENAPTGHGHWWAKPSFLDRGHMTSVTYPLEATHTENVFFRSTASGGVASGKTRSGKIFIPHDIIVEPPRNIVLVSSTYLMDPLRTTST